MSRNAFNSTSRRLLDSFHRGSSMRPSKGDLMCKNGCGFYGNPEWQWYCSKCWRQQQLKSSAHYDNQRVVKQGRQKLPIKQESETVSNHHHTNINRRLSEGSPKKKVTNTSSMRHPGEKTLKHMFGIKQKDKNESLIEPKTPTKALLDSSSEAKPFIQQISSFLNQRLDKSGVNDAMKQLNSFLEKTTLEVDSMAIDDLSTHFQDFYQNVKRRFLSQDNFQNLSENDIDELVDLIEKFVSVYNFKNIFCPLSSSDEEKDLQLQNRIRRLNWVSTKHLGCVITESSQDVRDALHKAINDILEMDGKLAPQEKLDSLVNCSKSIFSMLNFSNEQAPSADEFLPTLIYVCLKANPPRMNSNINYIMRFRNEEKLRMGEAGYFFTNLCCAISFIEQMTAESLNMDQEEFDSYLSGRVVPPGSWKSTLLMCESLQGMSQNIKILEDIRHRYDKIQEKTQKLQESMDEFKENISNEVNSVLDKTSYTIRGPKKPIALDDVSMEAPNNSHLPEPLMPNTSIASSSSSVNATIDDDSSALLESLSQIRPDDNSGYRGFSAQNFDIPSISCSNSIQLPPKTE